MTEQTITRGTAASNVSSSFITAATISLRCPPSFLPLIFKLTLTGYTGLLYSQSPKTQLRCRFFVHHNPKPPSNTHTHTLFSTSLLASLRSPQRPILLFQLWSLLEVSYSVQHTMQICDCCCAFGPSNYLNPNKCYIINKHQTTKYTYPTKSNTGLQESLFGVN